jgi:hypothetical protein
MIRQVKLIHGLERCWHYQITYKNINIHSINGANWNHIIKNYCYDITNWYLEVKGTYMIEIVGTHTSKKTNK